MGVVFNGLVGYEAAFLRREALLTALYRDLDELSEQQTRHTVRAKAETHPLAHPARSLPPAQNMTDSALPDWVNGRFVFETDDTRWHLVLERGDVVALAAGGVENPNVAVRWRADHARSILNYSLQGNDAMAVTTVVDGAYLGPPAPLDLVGRPELSMLPSIPGATLGVQYLFHDGPFGDVMHTLVFEDGRLVAQHLGKLERIDAMVEVTYRAMARVRAGEITILEALEGGKVAGELGPLALLAGITESKEFHEAELATGRHAIALAALGQVWRHPELMRRMRDLEVPTPPANPVR